MRVCGAAVSCVSQEKRIAALPYDDALNGSVEQTGCCHAHELALVQTCKVLRRQDGRRPRENPE